MKIRSGLLVGGAFLAALTTPLYAELVLPVEPLDDAELASLRGGFVVDNLEIAIGLEQVVAINGDTMVVNRLTIPNLNQVVNGRALDHHLETLVQFAGPHQDGGGVVASNLQGAAGWLTLIQNNLDSTVIQNIRQLNIELNNLGSGYHMPPRLNDHLLQVLGR